MKYAKIIDHPNLVRDLDSGAVLNVDHNARDNFLKAREIKRKDKMRLDTLENDVKALNNKLNVILELLLNNKA
jgi:hypothetical protein